MKCNDCREKDIAPTISEKVQLWIVNHLFGTVINDVRSDSFTQGFSQGYECGFERADNLSRSEISRMIKMYETDNRKNKKRAS